MARRRFEAKARRTGEKARHGDWLLASGSILRLASENYQIS